MDQTEVQKGLTLDSIVWAFTTVSEGNWLPLPWLSFMLDVSLFGINSTGHHAVNLLLHIVNSILLMLALYRMTYSLWQSAAVAALFAVHPLHVESVAWIAQREDLIGGLFFALTLLSYSAYVRKPSVRRYSVLLVFYFMGLCSRQMLLTIPFLLLLLDYWPMRRVSLQISDPVTSVTFRRLIIEKIPLMILTAAMLVIGLIVQNKTGNVIRLSESSVMDNWSNAMISYVSYIYMTLLPLKLSVFYPFHNEIPLWKVVMAVFFLLSASYLVIRRREQFPFLVTGWFWFLGMLVPAVGFIRLGDQAMADRYTYLPLTGLFIMAVWSAEVVVKKYSYARKFSFAAGVLVIVLLSFLTWIQAAYWRNVVTLFDHANRVTEGNWVAQENLGTVHAKMGDYDRAIFYLNESLKNNPRNYIALGNLGTVYKNLGNYDEAIRCYLRAIEMNARYEMAHLNLGITLLAAGDIEGAMTEYTILRDLFQNPDSESLLSIILQRGQGDANH